MGTSGLSFAQIAVGAMLGSFLGGVGVVVWGDARYARKEDYVAHVEHDANVEYATKADLDAHRREGHEFTKIQLTGIQAQLAAIQTDLSWLKATTMPGARKLNNPGERGQ